MQKNSMAKDAPRSLTDEETESVSAGLIICSDGSVHESVDTIPPTAFCYYA